MPMTSPRPSTVPSTVFLPLARRAAGRRRRRRQPGTTAMHSWWNASREFRSNCSASSSGRRRCGRRATGRRSARCSTVAASCRTSRLTSWPTPPPWLPCSKPAPCSLASRRMTRPHPAASAEAMAAAVRGTTTTACRR